MNMKIALGTGLLLLTAACSHPIERSATRGADVAAIMLEDAPEGAVIRVGDVSAYADSDGEARLVVESGWHDVTVMMNGQEIHSERIFVQDGTQRVIDLAP